MYKNKIQNIRGFTLVELIFVIAIFGILFGMGAVALGNFVTNQALVTAKSQLTQNLREARTFSMTQHHDSKWGVYFNTVPEPDGLILFQGNSYAGRDSSFDMTTTFHKSVTFSNINLAGGGQEIVFDKRTGQTGDSGTMQLGAVDDSLEISVNELGIIN